MKENISPWLHNFKYEREVKQLMGSIYTDIAIIGGGIAGVSTAYMLLKYTDKNITLIEGDLIAHGATGHNAGYVIAEFEQSFKEIVTNYGLDIARVGQKEIEDAWDIYSQINEEIGLGKIEKIDGYEAFSQAEHLISYLHEEYLKYGEIRCEVYINENSKWQMSIPENFQKCIKLLSLEEFNALIISTKEVGGKYNAIIKNKMAVSNSAIFTEELVKFCQKQYPNRFKVYEKTFVNSIRLLQNNDCILDTLYGVCISDKVILCTNGFENFNIYGPYGMKIDKDFHMQVSGLIGYMIGTFLPEQKSVHRGSIFYGDEYKFQNGPLDAGPYIYCTNRNFIVDDEKGELFSVGGPEIELRERQLYKKDHLVDASIYKKLIDFQKDIYSIDREPVFKWHGLMGYTKTGIRIVGQDKRFLDLFYNLGCNGIGIVPSIAGAKRLARLVSGEKLPPSIFDPR